MFKIILKKRAYFVYLLNKLFLKQVFLKNNKKYTFLYILHILNKYGYECYLIK